MPSRRPTRDEYTRWLHGGRKSWAVDFPLGSFWRLGRVLHQLSPVRKYGVNISSEESQGIHNHTRLNFWFIFSAIRVAWLGCSIKKTPNCDRRAKLRGYYGECDDKIAPLPLPPSAPLQNIIAACSPLDWCLDQMSESGPTAPREPCCGSSFSSLLFSRMSENRGDEAQVGAVCASTRNTLHDQTNLLSSPSRCFSRLCLHFCRVRLFSLCVRSFFL